ncbi:MAG: carbamoyltransferase C-terminal domain-containing protein, partial [Acidobacteriota bacterium]
VALLVPQSPELGAARLASFVLRDPRRPPVEAPSSELANERLSALPAPRSALTLPERVETFEGLEDWPLILQEKDIRLDQRAALPGLFPIQTRVQVLHPELDGLVYRVVAAFAERTGCGVISASPFHLLGRPDLVSDPRAAVHDFLISSSDALLLGDRLLVKKHGAGARENLLPFRPNLSALAWRRVERQAPGSDQAMILRSHAPGASRHVIKVNGQLQPVLAMCDGGYSIEQILEKARQVKLIAGDQEGDALCGFLHQLWLKGILCFDDPPADAMDKAS